MNSKTVSYRDWTFLVDAQRTKQAYEAVSTGDAENFGSNESNNFAANRANIFPSEIKELLGELGVDYRKEPVVFHMGRTVENGKAVHHYSGHFHFKGEILDGIEFKASNGNTASSEIIKVNSNFIIWISSIITKSFFEPEETEELIQLEFSTVSDWVIDKELEENE